jgi:hypothetical protein
MTDIILRQVGNTAVGLNITAEVPTLSEAGWGWIASELTIAPLARCKA